MNDKPGFRMLTSEEVDKFNFKDDFIEITIDFSKKLKNSEVEISLLLDFIKDQSKQYENTDISPLLSSLHTLYSSIQEKDGKDKKMDTIIKMCVGRCGTCGCHPTRNCRPLCAGNRPFCGACACYMC
jgi:hypothetical protein